MTVTGRKADAVIIGSGHNALACAVHLTAKGWSVEVFEQASVPGGAVKSAELTEPGFQHDWAAMNLSLFAGSPFFNRYKDKLEAHGVEFVPAAAPFASVFPNGNWIGVSTDRAANTDQIKRFSEQDAARWSELSDAFPQRAAQILGVLGSKPNIRAFALQILKSLRQPGGAVDLVRFLLQSPRAWLDETFETDEVKATLAAWGMHLDFAPDIAGGAVFPYLEAMAGQAFGMVLGKGGAACVTQAMQSLIEAQGGRVTCNTPVKRVLHTDGQAHGVTLESGETVHARRAVIANVAPSGLLKLTGSTGAQGYDATMRGFRHAPGTMMIHLAMDDLPDWSAGPALRNHAYVHLAPSMDQMARTYQQAKAGLLPDEPVIVVGQPTTVDPSRAPEGKHVLWLQVRMAPGQIHGDAAGEISATDWADAAEPFAERALDILERYAPGVRENIRARRIVPPTELEADNPNLVGGDQICGSHHLSQNFLFRPTRGHADGSTPIKQLFLTGAAVWPGAGTGAGSGFQLAQKLAGK